MTRLAQSTVRIIGGLWRSRRIAFPHSPEVRPTPDRVRETLFNWLGQDLSGRACLDLFAGSGALGFEALSRGASSVTMVERNAAALSALRDNARRLDAWGATIVGTDALEFVARAPRRYDVIFLDPPFRHGVEQRLWSRLPGLVADGGVIYLESRAVGDDRVPESFAPIRSASAGRVRYQLLVKV